MSATKRFTVLLAAALVAAAAAAHAKNAAQKDKRTLEPVEIGDVEPVHRFGRLYLAAQPTPDDLARFKQLGVRTVINLRMPDEIDWDAESVVEELGMRYVSIPFGPPESLTDEVIARAVKAMQTKKHRPLLLHCSTSNRTGAIWYVHRILNDGLDREAALEEAKQVGLRTMAYIERINEYLDADM